MRRRYGNWRRQSGNWAKWFRRKSKVRVLVRRRLCRWLLREIGVLLHSNNKHQIWRWQGR